MSKDIISYMGIVLMVSCLVMAFTMLQHQKQKEKRIQAHKKIRRSLASDIQEASQEPKNSTSHSTRFWQIILGGSIIAVAVIQYFLIK